MRAAPPLCICPRVRDGAPPPAATTAPAAAAKPTEAAKPAAPAAQPAAQATTAPAPQAAPAKTSGNVTLTWITPAEVGPERDFYTGFAQAFEQQNPNIK